MGFYHHAPAALAPRKRHGTDYTEGWMSFRAGLDGSRISRLTGIRSRDRPAFSESLYWLRYPSPLHEHGEKLNEHNIWHHKKLVPKSTNKQTSKTEKFRVV